MKKIYYILLPIITYSSAVFCDILSDIAPGHWGCVAFDNSNQAYTAQGIGIANAMSAAKAICQKNTKASGCRTAESFCQQGPTSLIEDRCIVSDESGRSWNTTGHNACKAAMELCNRWQYLHQVPQQCSVTHR